MIRLQILVVVLSKHGVKYSECLEHFRLAVTYLLLLLSAMEPFDNGRNLIVLSVHSYSGHKDVFSTLQPSIAKFLIVL